MQYCPETVAAAEAFAKNITYIAVSSLGKARRARSNNGLPGIRPKNIHPHWVTVPLLYALSRIQPALIPRLIRRTAETKRAKPSAKDDGDDLIETSNGRTEASIRHGNRHDDMPVAEGLEVERDEPGASLHVGASRPEARQPRLLHGRPDPSHARPAGRPSRGTQRLPAGFSSARPIGRAQPDRVFAPATDDRRQDGERAVADRPGGVGLLGTPQQVRPPCGLGRESSGRRQARMATEPARLHARCVGRRAIARFPRAELRPREIVRPAWPAPGKR